MLAELAVSITIDPLQELANFGAAPRSQLDVVDGRDRVALETSLSLEMLFLDVANSPIRKLFSQTGVTRTEKAVHT